MSDIIDLAAFRAAKAAKATEAEKTEPEDKRPGLTLEIRGDGVVLDHPDLDHTLTWSAEHALEIGRRFMQLGGLLKAQLHANKPEVIAAAEERRRRNEKFRRVELVGANGKKLPPLKVRGWSIETIGGSPGSTDTRWYRMTSPKATRLRAEQLRKAYELHHGADRVRVVPVDHRGRVIPPERMPTDVESVEVPAPGRQVLRRRRRSR